MKKTFLKFAYVSAIALTGMMGFSACQSDSAEEVNPNYDAETNSVKTEFAFNISSNAKQKMAADVTQQDGETFKGMNTMWLYCLATDPAADKTFLSNGQINLGSLANTEISKDQSSKIYSMYLPVGTKNFLFYGSQVAHGEQGKHAKGQLTKPFKDADTKYDNKANVGAITFALTPIVEVGSTVITTPGKELVKYLNDILKAKENTNNITWIGTQWYLDDAQSTNAETPDFKEIASLYFAFVKDMNCRQLSGFETLRSVQDLYNSIVRVNNKSTNAKVKAVAAAVMDAIDANFTASETTPGSGVYTLAYQTDDAKITEFPSNQGLPVGAAVVTITPETNVTEKTFADFDEFKLNVAGENTLGQTIATPTYEITYPSELTYFTNSKAVTSESAHSASDYPITVANWDADVTTATWNGDWRFPGTVSAATTAAAIRQNIKYGAAQLVSTVKITPTLSDDKLIDNAKAITVTNDAYDLLADKEDQKIDYSDGMFTWTGILIGGQPTQSDWQFLPSGERSRVIYDNVINTTAITKSVTSPYKPTYTLVMDNYNSTDPQEKVNIALELVNNTGHDFYGKDGLIPANGTFYLVGQLDPASGTGLADWTTAGVYTGANNTIAHPGYGKKRVFIQDFKTTVNFNISENALQKAYSSIPDLRSTKLLFGLSVDLTWKAGLSFDIDLGQ